MAQGGSHTLKRTPKNAAVTPRNRSSSHSSMGNLSGDDSAIVAIDFGTTQSCYAYVMKKKANDIYVHTWEEGSNSMKTPTSILLEKEDGGDGYSFRAFGHQAEREYWSAEGEAKENLELYRRFKMKLHNEKEVGGDMFVMSEKGRKESTKTIISMALKFIKTHATQNHLPSIVHNNITWVITVPAIWSEKSRLFMKESAVEAGLVPDMDSDKLKIGVEPEAAAFLCMEKSGITKFGDERRGSQVWLEFDTGNAAKKQEGDHFMVLDGGGGTMDIIAFKFNSDGSLSELIEPSGGPFGGCCVDDAFEEWLKNTWGKEYIAELKEKCPTAWNSLTFAFMKGKGKCKFGKEMIIQIDMETDELIREALGEGLGEKVKRGRIIIDSVTIESLFNPTLNEIKMCLDQLLLANPRMDKVKYAFLVGGFGSSDIVCEYLSDYFKDINTNRKQAIECCFPSQECWTAVAKGAILFVLNESKVSTRIATKTIGRKIVKRFVPGGPTKENDKHVFVNKRGEKMVKDVFEPFVKKGESYDNKLIRKFTTKPTNPKENSVFVEIFHSVKAGDVPVYVDDPNVSRYFSTRVKLPNDQDKKITTEVTFGTDIKMKIKTANDEKEVKLMKK